MQPTQECQDEQTTDEQVCNEDATDGQDWRNDKPKKLPPWVIAVAIAAFLVFNAFFLVFAMQMGSGTAD